MTTQDPQPPGDWPIDHGRPGEPIDNFPDLPEDPGGEVKIDPDEDKDESTGGGPTRAPGSGAPGVLRGGTVVRVARPGAPDVWYMRYEFPEGSGQFHMYQFESREALDVTLGDGWTTSGKFRVVGVNEDYLRTDGVFVVDSAAAITGVGGQYNTFMEDIVWEAALEAGVTDPGLIGEFVSNPEIQNLLALSAVSGWSGERLQAEIRGTDFYRNELYPGIDFFFGQGSPDPEGEWRQYVDNVDAALELMGVKRDEDGTYRTSIGELLGQGVSDEQLLMMAPAFNRAANSPGYFDALNQWFQAETGKELSFDDMFDVFDGNTTPELEEILERGNLQYAADTFGFGGESGIDPALIKRLSNETSLSEEQIVANFSDAEISMLALGDEGLRRAGLNQRQLVNAAFGLTSGIDGQFTSNEIQKRARKFSIELGLQDDPKAQLFVGFTDDGQPIRPGLAGITPHGTR